jgi:hypothetical protein
MQPQPADTGELPPTAANIPPDQRNMPYPGQQYSPDPSLPSGQPTPPGTTQGANDPQAGVPGRGQPSGTPIGGGAGNVQESPSGRASDPTSAPLSKKQYEDVLKGQGLSPSEAKKRADASTPEQRAAAGGDNLPTKKPSDGDRPYHMDGDGRRGVSNITRDRAGMQGVPQMLGQLAQAVMPLLGGLMSGGGGMFGGRGRFHGRGFPWGRGGHGRFGGRFQGGHPGGHGSGMYPYHHPGMGWSGFNHHPGGGWRPLDPKYAASMGGQVGGGVASGLDGDGGGDMSQLAPILQALGINVPGMGGGQGGFRQGGRFGGNQQGGGGMYGGQGGTPYQGSGNPVSQSGGTASPDDIMATIRQRESGSRNLPPWQGHDASGIYQIKPATWAAWARDSGDPQAAQYQAAYQAPPEVQERLARWALMKYGANASYTWKASGPDLGRPYPSVAAGSGGNARPGTTGTGGTMTPNPSGNTAALPANQQPTQVTPSWSPDA